MRIVVSGTLEEDRTCRLFRPSVFAALLARKFPPKFPHLAGHNPQTGSPKCLQLIAFSFTKPLLISPMCDRVILLFPQQMSNVFLPLRSNGNRARLKLLMTCTH